MNVYHHHPAHRQQQREPNFQPRSLPGNAADHNRRPLPAPAPPGPPTHLDSDRVLPPLATSSDGSKFVPFWKRNQQHFSALSSQQIVQQQQALQPPKKKWLTQAEMGMVSPAIIPLPVPTARTSTTTTTTTTSNTSTTTNNNLGTTVSSSGSGITASSVSGRTFNYNYNNYNHHVHQFNQPPSNHRPAPSVQPGAPGPGYKVNGYIDQAGKPMTTTRQHARPPTTHRDERRVGEEEEEEEEEYTSESEEGEPSSAPPSPQYGILDLPSRSHRVSQRPHSAPHDSYTKQHGKAKSKKIVYQDPGLPTPPSVLVLQAPSSRRTRDYTPAYAYEYSLKHDQYGRHSRTERKKGRRSRLEWEEVPDDEDDSEESEEEEEESPPAPKKKKSRVRSDDKKNAKGKDGKKSKIKGKGKATRRLARSRRSREEEESEEEESEESEEESEEEESEEERELRRKTKKRMSTLPEPDKKKNQNMSMSLQFATFGIDDNHVNHRDNNRYSRHRFSRSDDSTRQSQSTFSPSSRNTPASTPSKWPVDLPRLPRTPGTPADAMSDVASFNTSSRQRNDDYFEYQPHQQQRPTQPRPPSHPGATSLISSASSSTPASTYSTPATSYTSMSDQGRQNKYVNLDDPPPSSLRRTPSPAYTSSSHSHTRSLPHIGVNVTSGFVPTSSTHEQVRPRVEQSQPQTYQAQPQPPARRCTQDSFSFQSSQAFWQQQVQHPPNPSTQPQHRILPSTGGPSVGVSGSNYGNRYMQSSAPSAHVPAPQTPNTPSRRRELPPQPIQGHERAQEILKAAIERQSQAYSPSPPRPQPNHYQQQQQQQQWETQPRQWPPTTQPGTSPPVNFTPRIQHRQPLPQSSFPQQQHGTRPPSSVPQQFPQPAPVVQQYHQPQVQQQPHYSQPPKQHQSHPLPQPPAHQQQPQQQLRQQQLRQQQLRQQQQQQQQQTQVQQQPPTRAQPQQHIQQPPQARQNVFRSPSLPLESPLPVGGRDKVANIPRMGKAANVADGTSGYGSGGSVSTSESEVESLQSAGQKESETSSIARNSDVPGIVIDVPRGDSLSSRTSSVATPSPQTPVVLVTEDNETGQGQKRSSPSVVPQIQVFDIPGISFSGPEDVGGGPTISISGPGDNPQPRPRSQPAPQVQTAQQRARSAPAFANANVNINGTAIRPSKGGMSCGGCGGSIIGRIVNAMGARWHPECFRCTTCNTLLEHVSSYEHEGKPYCHLDYHENFAPRCYHCKTAIIEERFISLDDPALGKRTYHEQHFFCAECGNPFLAPSSSDYERDDKRSGELALSGDGEFESDDVGFTVYRGHPYCESCHVRLRLPKCKRCKNSIRDGDRAVEALGGKWCWACFVCESCQKPFDDPAFFQRAEKPYCEPCFSLMLRNEV